MLTEVPEPTPDESDAEAVTAVLLDVVERLRAETPDVAAMVPQELDVELGMTYPSAIGYFPSMSEGVHHGQPREGGDGDG